MKNSILILLLSMIVQMNSFAQPETGTKFIGGSFSINHFDQGTNGININNLNITPAFGYFLSNRVALGVHAGYKYSVQKTNFWEQVNNTFQVGPFLRQFITLDDRFLFYLQESLLLSRGSNKQINTTGPDSESSTIGISLSVRPGLIFFPTSRIGIESMLGNLFMDLSKVKDIDSGTTDNRTSYGLNLNPDSFSIGLKYYF